VVGFSTPVASDTFGRAVAGGLGAADLGGAYTYAAGHQPAFSVNGAAGLMTVPTPGQSRQAWLAGVSARDVDATIAVASSNAATGGFGQTFSLQLRRVALNTEYRARLRFAPDGTVRLGVFTVNGSNTEVAVGPEVIVPGVAHVPGQAVALRAQVEGASPTTIRLKAWTAGTPEPSAWTLERTDSLASLQVAGGVGVMGYLSGSTVNAPTTFTFDDLVVRRGLV
jgi:hypothetical protein